MDIVNRLKSKVRPKVLPCMHCESRNYIMAARKYENKFIAFIRCKDCNSTITAISYTSAENALRKAILTRNDEYEGYNSPIISRIR